VAGTSTPRRKRSKRPSCTGNVLELAALSIPSEPPSTASTLLFLRPPLDSPEAVLVSSDPSSGSESGGLELILREEAWRGPPGPDILGMICSSPPSFCPCLRTRVAAACIHWTRLVVRAGLGGAVGSVSALTGAGHLRFGNERGTCSAPPPTEERGRCFVCTLMQVFPFLLDRGSIVASLTPHWINHSFGPWAQVGWVTGEAS